MGGAPLLLVESDVQLRERWLQALSGVAQVAMAADAEQALELFARQHPRWVVLGQPHLGDDGQARLSLLAELTSLDPKAFVAVLADNADDGTLWRSALRMGAFDVATPDVAELRRVVADMAAEAQAQRLASQVLVAP